MLATATSWLISQSDKTYAIGRHASAVAEKFGFLQIDADWNKANFPDRVSNALSAVPSIDCALLWLHEPETVLPWLSRHLAAARVVLMLGSTDGHTHIPASATSWATVRLGSKAGIGGRRWLTNNEISAGAIASLEDGLSRVVGELISLR